MRKWWIHWHFKSWEVSTSQSCRRVLLAGAVKFLNDVVDRGELRLCAPLGGKSGHERFALGDQLPLGVVLLVMRVHH